MVHLRALNRLVAVTLCVTVFCMGLPPRRAAAAPADGAEGEREGELASLQPLRDAVPASSFVSAPPDTSEEDEFFLPEEKDNKKLIRDITVFVIASAFVAFFIIKVFIEEEEDTPPPPPNGKPIPPLP